MTSLLKKTILSVFSKFGLSLVRTSKSNQDKIFLFEINRENIEIVLYLKRMMDKVSGIKGDIVECGVGMTRSFQILALFAENDNRKIWGFDSFEGFPEPTIEDSSPRNLQKGEWKYLSVQDVYNTLGKIKLSPEFIKSNVNLVEGFFEDTLPEHSRKIPSIALLHLDVDLYKSYKDCLKYLFPKVVKGGIILFDEYTNEEQNWPGAKKAIDEYFRGMNYEIQKDIHHNKYFLIKK